MSWYLYLNREQLYQRNYRSHNLWLNFYNQKMRQPKIAPFHIALFKRVAKSYSGARIAAMFWGLSFICIGKSMSNFTAQAPDNTLQREGYHRLLTIFSKNQYGYNTRFMSDFELFLDSMLNEKFLDDSTLYYNDPMTAVEISDQEQGLTGDFAPSDVQSLLHDQSDAHHESFKAMQWPDRVGTNYPKEQLSCYKILPKKQ